MTETLVVRHGVRILRCAANGPKLRTDHDAVDVIARALESWAQLVVVPVPRLDSDFFVLRSRVAGEIVQKFVNYRLQLAIVGDITQQLAESSALRDFVSETNRGNQLWILASPAELEVRVASLGAQRQ